MKLIALNVEGHKHLDLQLPFFLKEEPDILCLQEVFAPDALMFAAALGMEKVFAPMATKRYPDLTYGEETEWGVAILSKKPMHDSSAVYYVGSRDKIVPQIKGEWATIQHVLLAATVACDLGRMITVGTTHFTWTPYGEANDMQRTNCAHLLQALAQFPEIVVCGDFNAPRGGEIFSVLAGAFRDNIPAHYRTSIDTVIHARGASGELDDKMVDGLFSTPIISVSNVLLQHGVSDHMAVIADIAK